MSKVVRGVSGILRFQEFGVTVYNEQLDVISTITAGTSISLPAAGTYLGSELSLFLNGQRMNYIEDYQYVGVGTRTQIQFLFDLVVDDKIIFRKET